MSTNGSVLSKGAVFEGKIVASDSVRIEGKLSGEARSNELIEVGEAGVIEGDLTAKHIITAGHIKGAVNAAEKIELKGTCRLEGDLITVRLVIEDGAQFEGRCSMGGKPKSVSAPTQVQTPSTPSPSAANPEKNEEKDAPQEAKKSGEKASSLFGRR
jgi:cytoskeletal protein CcmA (bactofilin family)